MKLYFILFWFLLGFVTSTQAQQPSYYRIGEKTCAGIDLYSITQDQEGDIWLSSNQGLLRYDGYTFHPYTSDLLKSSSLFGLKKDRQGTIYCNNLVGQIFRITNDSLQLFLEIPDSLLSSFIEFNFDNQNQLVFRTSNYYKVDSNGTIQLLFEDKEGNVRNIPYNAQEELVLIDPFKNTILFYKDDSIRVEYTPPFDEFPSDMRYFFNLHIDENRVFAHGQRMPSLLEKEVGRWNPIRLESFNPEQVGWNTHILSDGQIWIMSERNGALVFKKNGEVDYQGAKLFPRFRISCFLEDQEGNLWLPTLGKGIIIIPNQAFVDYRNHPLLKEEDIQSIAVDRRDILYLGGISGTVYKVQDGEVSIFKKGPEKISFLHYINTEDALVLGSEKIHLGHHNQPPEKALFSKAKDVISVDQNQYLKATFSGIEFFDTKKEFNSPIAEYFKTFKNIPFVEGTYFYFPVGRTFTLTWEPVQRHIWAGTTRGLKVIQPDTIRSLFYKDKPIIANDLLYANEHIWVATKNQGILVYQQDSLSLHLHTGNGLLSNTIRKIIIKEQQLYLISEKGLQIYHLANRSFTNITQSDGLLSEFILDFAIVDQKAWLVFNNGVQEIPLNPPYRAFPDLNLEFHQILVNGASVDIQQPGQFEYNQNEIAFHFLAKGHRHRGNLTYQYRLEGLRKGWSENNYDNNQVEYQSLPPGKYQFQIRVIDENRAVSPIIKYSFSIASPFWMTGWFYTLCLILIIAIIAGIFKFREYIITQRLRLENKLKASEVTALKAQMNPHFIFNTLNSIQDLILMDDIRASNIYLGKFADLMRMLLHASGENQIPLAQEIQLLELYLEMEQLRFGSEFSSSIQTDLSPSQCDRIEIPSLLIQPYVENAIKHGLLHKKGQKNVDIQFYLEDQALHCTITDNGIGRTQSAQINARRQKKHVSFATAANQKRIDLINEANRQQISISIQDVQPELRFPGTVVHLTFPLPSQSHQ